MQVSEEELARRKEQSGFSFVAYLKRTERHMFVMDMSLKFILLVSCILCSISVGVLTSYFHSDGAFPSDDLVDKVYLEIANPCQGIAGAAVADCFYAHRYDTRYCEYWSSCDRHNPHRPASCGLCDPRLPSGSTFAAFRALRLDGSDAWYVWLLLVGGLTGGSLLGAVVIGPRIEPSCRCRTIVGVLCALGFGAIGLSIGPGDCMLIAIDCH